MRIWILSFSLGVFVGSFIPVLPPALPMHLLWLPLLLCWWWRSLFMASAFCLGLWCLLVQASYHQTRLLPPDLEQVDLWASGFVSDLPQQGERSTRFVFITSSLCLSKDLAVCAYNELRVGRKLLLNDYNGQAYMPGEYWQLQVRLKRPHGFANPGGFDYERWLFQEKVTATGYVRAVESIPVSAPALTRGFDRLRVSFQSFLQDLHLASPGFLSALTIGDRYRINDRQWQLLTLTGTNHLMVISGLHIGLVAWLAYRLAIILCRCCPGLGLRVPAPRLAAMAAIIMAASYSGLAGFTLPVVRALVMVSCLMSGELLVRQTSALNNLCLALLLVLILDPLAIQSTGFWLSFSAVAILLAGVSDNTGPQSWQKRLALSCRLQYRLFLGLLPLMLFLFQQVSLLAPLVNLFAIPFIGLCVVPLCLLALMTSLLNPGLGAWLITIPDFLLVHYERGLTVLVSQLDFLLVEFPTLPAGWLLIIMLVSLLYQFRPRAMTCMVMILLMLLCFRYQPARLQRGQFSLDVLDVGQGLAMVISTRDHVLIYDTGPAYSSRFNAGGGIVLPFLRHQNFRDPDMIMLSHGDNDHAGGLAALIERYPTAPIVTGEIVPDTNGSQILCREQPHWQWDAVHFEVLVAGNESDTGNNASCVLKISTGEVAVLLPGDMEQAVELELVRRYQESLQAWVLVAPHHGSATSSTPPFVRRVNPDQVVFTTGYLNRFNHPHPDVVARYRRLGSRLHDTAHTGAIRFLFDPQNGVSPAVAYREIRPRFWSDRR